MKKLGLSSFAKFAAVVLLSSFLQPTVGHAKNKKEAPVAKSSPRQSAVSIVDINSATKAELMEIPGIGESYADKIIAGRPYRGKSDLKTVIPEATYRKISSSIVAKRGPNVAKKTPALALEPENVPAATPRLDAPAAAPPAAPTTASRADPAPEAVEAPGGGNGLVWVNQQSKIYHRQGQRWYGKTKKGEFLSEAQAVQQGYRLSKE